MRDNLCLHIAIQSPEFVKPWQSHIIISQGAPLTLNCFASGAPIPSYRWFKDGTVIQDDDKFLDEGFNIDRSRLVSQFT